MSYLPKNPKSHMTINWPVGRGAICQPKVRVTVVGPPPLEQAGRDGVNIICRVPATLFRLVLLQEGVFPVEVVSEAGAWGLWTLAIMPTSPARNPHSRTSRRGRGSQPGSPRLPPGENKRLHWPLDLQRGLWRWDHFQESVERRIRIKRRHVPPPTPQGGRTRHGSMTGEAGGGKRLASRSDALLPLPRLCGERGWGEGVIARGEWRQPADTAHALPLDPSPPQSRGRGGPSRPPAARPASRTSPCVVGRITLYSETFGPGPGWALGRAGKDPDGHDPAARAGPPDAPPPSAPGRGCPSWSSTSASGGTPTPSPASSSTPTPSTPAPPKSSSSTTTPRPTRPSGRLRRTPAVAVKRFDRNTGFAKAANEGCRLARGEWVLLLNPDTAVPEGFLDQLDGPLPGPRPGGAAGRRRRPVAAARGRDGAGVQRAAADDRAHARRSVPAAAGAEVPAGPGDDRVAVPWVTGLRDAHPPGVLGRAGGFDQSFFLLLRGRRLLPAGVGGRLVGLVRAGPAADPLLPAAHPAGPAGTAAHDPARPADLRPEVLGPWRRRTLAAVVWLEALARQVRGRQRDARRTAAAGRRLASGIGRCRPGGGSAGRPSCWPAALAGEDGHLPAAAEAITVPV